MTHSGDEANLGYILFGRKGKEPINLSNRVKEAIIAKISHFMSHYLIIIKLMKYVVLIFQMFTLYKFLQTLYWLLF